MSNGKTVLVKNNGVLVISRIAVSMIVILVLVFLYDQGVYRDTGDMRYWEGFFFWLLGAIFLLSRKLANFGYIFKAIDFFSREWAVVGGRYRAQIYGVVSCCVAAWKHFQWLNAG